MPKLGAETFGWGGGRGHPYGVGGWGFRRVFGRPAYVADLKKKKGCECYTVCIEKSEKEMGENGGRAWILKTLQKKNQGKGETICYFLFE